MKQHHRAWALFAVLGACQALAAPLGKFTLVVELCELKGASLVKGVKPPERVRRDSNQEIHCVRKKSSFTCTIKEAGKSAQGELTIALEKPELLVLEDKSEASSHSFYTLVLETGRFTQATSFVLPDRKTVLQGVCVGAIR